MASQPRTTPSVLDQMARELPDNDALITDDRSFTFAELRDEVRRTAAAMIGRGIAPGDRVAIWSPNPWHWLVACLAVHYAGAVMVPLNTRYTAAEAGDILARTHAPLLIAISGANGCGPRFTAPALWRIFRYSQGIPRLINAVCDKCLLAGFVKQTDRIDFGTVGRAIRELEGNLSI